MSDFYSIFERMFTKYAILNINIIVIIIALVLMLWLFWKDFKSYGNEHKDFKSTLVSAGVLGTFIGIFIGLWGFDTGDSSRISSSIPKLLDGLKTAFITSIFGMFLAILLSIIQKFKGGNVAEDEITALNNISKQLEKLNKLESIDKHTETLPLINKKLDSIDINMKGLSADISSVKEELKINQESLFGLLETKLSAIDNSLNEAVQTLAQGATEEIIKALENVITDFNQNLTEQFGDNFKQLNEAVLKMIEWQDKYKNSIQKFEKQLKLTTENTAISHKNTTDLIEKFITKNNKALLENIEKINSVTTQNTDTLIHKVDVFSNEINKSLKDNVKQNQQANEKIKERLKQLFEQTKIAVSITKSNAERIENVTDNYEKIAEISKNLETVITTNQNQIENLETHLENLAIIGEDAGGITTELANFSKKIQGSLSNQSQALAQLTEGIEQKLPRALESLETTLTALTKNFTENYEEFLKRFNEIRERNNE